MNIQICHALFSLVNVKSTIHGFNYSKLTLLVSTLGLECIFHNIKRNYLKKYMLILEISFAG